MVYWVLSCGRKKCLQQDQKELEFFGQFSTYDRPELVFLMLLSLVIAHPLKREWGCQIPEGRPNCYFCLWYWRSPADKMTESGVS